MALMERTARGSVRRIRYRIIVLKASRRLLKKIQRRDARKIDERRRTYSTSQRGD